jgi:hypothetical protein
MSGRRNGRRTTSTPWAAVKVDNVIGDEDLVKGPRLLTIPPLIGMRVTVNPIGITVSAEGQDKLFASGEPSDIAS